MHRTDSVGSTADHLFTDGDPANDIKPTQLDAVWTNDVQENICRVIEAAGIELVKGDYEQLKLAIAAFIANAMLAGTTPPQFDTTTKLATMEALQRALGNSQAHRSITGATTLTAADAGKVLFCSGVTYQITLPSASTCPSGSRVKLINGGTGTVTVARAGADNILAPTLAALTSVALLAGDTVDLLSNGVHWFVVGGSAALKYASGAFASGVDYQTLPDGTLMQWVYGTTSASGPIEVTYPIAFKSVGRAVAILGGNAPYIATTQSSGTPLTSVLLNGWTTAGARVATSFILVAVGR